MDTRESRREGGATTLSLQLLPFQLLPFLFNSIPSSPARRISFLDIALPPNSSWLPFHRFFRTSHASCYCLCISNPGFKPIPNYTTTAACYHDCDAAGFPRLQPALITSLYHSSDEPPSSTSSIFTLKFFPPELDFRVYPALRGFLDELVYMHALAKQEDDGMLATVHSFVNSARRAFDARFREWAPEVMWPSRSLPMASPPPPRPLTADPART